MQKITMSTASMYGTDTISGRVIAATVVGMVLPAIAVLGRLTARFIKGIRLYLDDYMIILALVGTLVFQLVSVD